MKFDVIIIGGDRKDAEAGLNWLFEKKSVCLIARGGLIGVSPEERAKFVQAGGTLLCSDAVSKVEWNEDGSVARLWTENLGQTPLEADLYVLAAGRFVSGGLRSDMNRVWEPVFGADVQFEPDPEKWCSEDFFAPQPFEGFGVKTAAPNKVLKDGKPVRNLIAYGEIIAHKIS
ncbi:MAG: FAD-binding protein [Bacteroidales bacterium]|nr:FAD-binding protein [Bacteroidales bacterium]